MRQQPIASDTPVIKVISPFNGWQRWAKLLGVTDPPNNIVMETDNYHTAALAVARGEGICLGIFPFLQPWADQHRIIPMEEFTCELEDSGYLVYAPHNKGNPVIDEFQDWLVKTLT